MNEQEIAQLNDPNVARADKDALITRSNQVYKELYEQVGAEGLVALNQRLGVEAVSRVYQAGGNDGLRTVVDVIGLENQGKIRNFDDWASFFSEGNRANDNIQDLLSELQEAKRVSGNLREGEIVDIGGDARAEVNERGQRQKTFDMKVENAQTGQTARNIEVKTLERPVLKAENLTEGIKHAIDKRIDATGGTVEATIQMELASQGNIGSITRIIDESGNYVDAYTIPQINPNTGRPDPRGGTYSSGSGNLFQDIKGKIVEIETRNQSRIRENSDVNLIDRVNLVRKDGSLFATYYKQNGQWKLDM